MTSFAVDTVFNAVDRMSAPIRNMQNRISRMAQSASDSMRRVQRRTNSLTKSMQDVGKKGLEFGAKGAAGIGLMTVAGVEFEQSMVNATAKMPGQIRMGTKEFERMSKVAQEVGRTTQFSATEAAKGFDYLAMAGFNKEQAMAALPKTTDLAVVASVDLATATDIATNTLGPFKLMSKDSDQLSKNLTRVNDVLAKTITSSNTDIEALFETLKTGGSVAAAAGASIEDAATMAGLLANAGIKGEMAGTALKNIFLAIGAPGSAAAGAFRELGVQTVDAEGNVRDVLDVFADFQKAMKALNQDKQMKVFNTIFGKIPIASAINLTNMAGEEMYAFREQLLQANGVAEEMADVMGDTTMGAIKGLLSAIEGVAIGVFSKWGGSLKKIVENMAAWVRENSDFMAQNIGDFIFNIADNIEKVVSAIKFLGTTFAVLWGLNTIINIVTGTMTLFNMIATANPIGLTVLAVAGLVTALVGLVTWMYANGEKIKNWFSDTFSFEIPSLSDLNPFSDDDEESGSGSTSRFQRNQVALEMSSPEERTASAVSETTTTTTSEVVIRDESGRAEQTSGQPIKGLEVPSSGGMD